MRDHFFVPNDTPYLAMMVSYSLTPMSQPSPGATAGKPPAGKGKEEIEKHHKHGA